jgi:arginyl-tRNA synthetase
MYPEVFGLAAKELSPHHICTYLHELAQTFNRFYENSQVLDDPRSAIRLALVKSYEQVLADGLAALGIPLPERM